MTGRRLTALLAGVLLAGCAGVPTSGPVEHVSASAAQQQAAGVRIDAEGPRENASPEIIVAGYLNAMASLTPGFAVARQYLTDQARETWDPGAGVVVTDASTQQLVPTAHSEVLTAPVVGRLDAQGRFVAGGGTLRHDFGLVKVNGQWRISRPPAGLVVSSSTFSTYYSPMTRWFLSPDGGRMVPETLEVPMARANPTTALGALLEGPSAWLSDAVMSAFPAGTRMPVASVPVTGGGVAQVDLPASIASLPEAQRERLAWQVAWTLNQFPTVTWVRLTAGGQPLAAPGVTASDGTIDLSGDLPHSPLGSTSQSVLAVQGGHLGWLDRAGTFDAVKGASASSGVTRVNGFAADQDADEVAFADAGGVHVVGSRGSRLVARGGSWGLPQVDAAGTLWDVGVSGSHPVLLRAPRSGTATVTPLTSIPTGSVRAFRVSPDGCRVAVVVQQGTSSRLGLVSLAADAHTGPWYPLTGAATTAAQQLTDVRDVAWTGTSTLAVLASTGAGRSATVFSVSDDGAQVTALGPVQAVDAHRLVARPLAQGIEVFVLTADGTLLRCGEAWRWDAVAHGVGAVAVPA